MKNLFTVFVGYDPVESAAWHTLVASLYERSSIPLSFVPVNTRNLKKIFHRERDKKQSNEFSFTRFLVPYLMEYEGLALYMDCDMLIRCDIAKLITSIECNPGKAVYVVKHDYKPKDTEKYLGTKQYAYPRKNWSSFVLWDCSHASNKNITPEYVNKASGMELHRFTWLNDDEIGALDPRWNWLVGEYSNAPADVFNLHWTLGGPYFKEYENTEFADEWFVANSNMRFVAQKK